MIRLAGFLKPFSTISRLPPRRALSVAAAQSRSDLFEYTSGRWLFNDAIRHAERRHVFNVEGLCRLAAQSVGRSPDDIVDFTKLTEGECDRTFLVTMLGGFQMVARVPYPTSFPKYYALASEVATMALLRSSGLPVPQVYGYAPAPDNAAETEYIFMEFIQGTKLSNVWDDLGGSEIISVVRQLAQLESKMMSIAFPAGGSLYYAHDLKKVAAPGVPLKDERFCVGPDVAFSLWYGRRSQLDVDRGPYNNAEAALIRGAQKELAYLKQFGRPLLPLDRMNRDAYQFKKQSPTDYMEDLERYLLIAPSLVPRDPALGVFCIRHRDLHQTRIVVSKSPNSNWQVVGLLDWQYTSILPVFLQASVPDGLENYGWSASDAMAPYSLPENFDDLDFGDKADCRRRLIHHHYVKNTEECNWLHYTALTDPMGALRRDLFRRASFRWEGELLVKAALIKATENWKKLAGRGVPCPVVFDAKDVRKTKRLNKTLESADAIARICRALVGCYGPSAWVPIEDYEEAMARNRQLQDDLLAEAKSAEEKALVTGHWIFGDVNEEEYM